MSATAPNTAAFKGINIGVMPTWFDYLAIAPTNRPSLLTPNKGREYDIEMSRYFLGRTSSIFVNWMRMCAAINEGFASGRIWGLGPDIQSYLMDKGSVSSRQPFQYPLFTPLLARQLGLLDQVDVFATAETSTQRAESRRQQYIRMAISMAMGAQAGGENVRAVMGAMGVSPDPNQAAQIADDNYEDPVLAAINSLVTMTAIRNKVEMLRKQVGQNITTSGLGAIHCFFDGSNICLEALNNDEVIYDVAARRPDNSDSEFVAVTKLRTIEELMEIHRGDRQTLEALETASKTGRLQDQSINSYWPQGMPRDFTVYYKDGDFVERGFIEGPNGPEMVTVGEIDPDTTKPMYTLNDLIDPPQTSETIDWKGKTDTRFIVKLRTCSFIPREYCPKVEEDGSGGEKKAKDLYLAGGPYLYNEADPDRTNSVLLPVKMGTFMNINGFIVAPLTAAQAPQRIMNIVASDFVNRIARAEGRSTVIGKRALAGANLSQDKAAQQVKDGDLIVIDEVISGSVGNSVGKVGEGIDPNVFKSLELLDGLKVIAEGGTQLQDTNFGAAGGANELVGVKRLQAAQAAITQQPYLGATRMVFQQTYEWIANVGRRFMLRHPSVLEDAIGTASLRVLQSIKDLDLEQVRINMRLAPNSTEIKQATDEMILLQYLPNGLLDAEAAADLLGNSYPEDANARSRRYTKDAKQAMQRMAEMQASGQQMAALDERDQQLNDQEHELYMKMMDAGVKSEASNLKAEVPMRSAAAKWNEPGAEAAATEHLRA